MAVVWLCRFAGELIATTQRPAPYPAHCRILPTSLTRSAPSLPPPPPPLPPCRRVGLMGYNAKPANVELVLAAFKDGLRQQGWELAAN